ncbi:MAG: hypothetical protein D6675_12265 [Gemmatimonadetes bacterium]|nr:MAG: hypothetical protein D6675_12265 [Gemmatimonadota bacterium]
MKVEKWLWDTTWECINPGSGVTNPQLVLFFGGTDVLKSPQYYQDLKDRYPQANIIGCSTSGEILDDEVLDDTIVVAAIEFAYTQIDVASVRVTDSTESFTVGKSLGERLNREGLRGMLVISDGQHVNGSELVQGFNQVIDANIPITGGLAGDADRFEVTHVSCNCEPTSGLIAAVGFYGDQIQIGHGSFGGWDAFGPTRRITRSKGNILYELDGKPALELYKKYLGEEAKNLPGSALLFPLAIYPADNPDQAVVRTILTIHEADQSMVFAGDVPEGYTAQLMMANFDRLVEGAAEAAKLAHLTESSTTKLAILISCVGRKLVLGQRTADEVEAVQEILGDGAHQIGFYSYGEISPHRTMGTCNLHNQTMTITLLSEHEA